MCFFLSDWVKIMCLFTTRISECRIVWEFSFSTNDCRFCYYILLRIQCLKYSHSNFLIKCQQNHYFVCIWNKNLFKKVLFRVFITIYYFWLIILLLKAMLFAGWNSWIFCALFYVLIYTACCILYKCRQNIFTDLNYLKKLYAIKVIINTKEKQNIFSRHWDKESHG